MIEKILIVDDDVETLRLVGLMLQRQGYRISVASNGSQAIALAKKEKPALIILDIMMPDVDGYQLAREIRQDAEISKIPILMFTAKSQIDDKVAGYDAGADDYLTKPIHPAELVAHIKALLGRNKVHANAPGRKGYTIGVLAPRGGLGTSSLVLNLAISYFKRHKTEVIAAEMQPGHGTWAIDLRFGKVDGLNTLLKMPPEEITKDVVESQLMRSAYGIRLLMTSKNLAEVNLINQAKQFEVIIERLQELASVVLLDIGGFFFPAVDNILAHCDELLLVTEPYPGTTARLRLLMDELASRGFGQSRLLSVVMVNRVRSDLQLSVPQIQERLSYPVAHVIPPAAELAYQADLHGIPLSLVRPDCLVSQQYIRLAEMIAERVEG